MDLRAPKTQQELVQSFNRLPLRFPRTVRELFKLLSMQDSSGGLEALLDRIDYSTVTPAAIYNLVHARAPESPSVAVPAAEYDPRGHFLGALRSKEFQAQTLRNFLRTFPEKRREIFLHIPKCAGTDLILNVAPNRLALPYSLALEGWFSKDEFLAAIGRLVQAVPFFDDIFVYGHIELANYIRTVGINPRDTFVTVLRDPFDLLLSQANYAVGRLRQDPRGDAPDAAGILHHLDLPRLPDDISQGDLKRLAVRCFLDPRIAQPNRTCFYLGEPAAPGYSRAISNLVNYDVEISATSHYARFLRERWDIPASSSRHNQSTSFLTKAEALRFFGEQVKPAIAEDQKLYDVVQWALAKTGKSSVSGTEIAALAGPALLDDLPERLAGRAGPAKPAARTIVVQETEEHEVARYLSAIPEDYIPDERRPVEVMTIEFLHKGNSKQFVAEGWARAEPRHTWTHGTKAVVTLPRPTEIGEMFIRLEGTPYTVPERLLHQRIGLAVNGVHLGTAVIRRPAVLEWEIPLDAMTGHDALEIELDLPDAARPMDVADVPDDRQLAIAVTFLRLLRIGPARADPGEVADVQEAFAIAS